MNGKLLVLKTQIEITQQQQLMSRAQNLALDIKQKIISQLELGTLDISQDRSDLSKFISRNQIQSKSNSVPHLNFQIPEYIKEDDDKTRQMIRKHKQYEQRLESSARELESKIKMEQLIMKQKQEEEKKKFFQDKKIKVLQSISQIKQRHQNRKKIKQQENAILNTVKSQKKLHQKLMEKWKQLNQKSEDEKNKLYEKLKEHKKISFQEIKEHAIRHDETMTKMRSSRLQQSRLSQPEVKKFYQSIYMSRIIQQEQENKQRMDSKKKQLKQLAQKRAQYGEIVRENYKPKVKQTNTEPTVQEIRKISRSLSHLETVHKGNDYMREINIKLSKNNKSALQTKVSQQKKSEYFKYRNYLTEIRVKKSESEKEMHIAERVRKNTYEKQIKKIMNETGLNEQQRFNKAKLLSKKFEVTYLKKDTFKLIDTINAKIEILRHVSG